MFMATPEASTQNSTGDFGRDVLRVLSRYVGFIKLEFARKLNQHRKRVCLHLSHYVPAMDLDGVFGDSQLEGCLFVQQTSYQKWKDLPFARCQGFIPSNKLRMNQRPLTACAILPQSPLN